MYHYRHDYQQGVFFSAAILGDCGYACTMKFVFMSIKYFKGLPGAFDVDFGGPDVVAVMAKIYVRMRRSRGARLLRLTARSAYGVLGKIIAHE